MKKSYYNDSNKMNAMLSIRRKSILIYSAFPEVICYVKLWFKTLPISMNCENEFHHNSAGRLKIWNNIIENSWAAQRTLFFFFWNISLCENVRNSAQLKIICDEGYIIYPISYIYHISVIWAIFDLPKLPEFMMQTIHAPFYKYKTKCLNSHHGKQSNKI